MKFLFLALIIFLLPTSAALEFSPSKLEFNLNQNQISCKNIYFSLDTQATLSDSWAQNENVPWSITQFQTTAQQHEITLNYPAQITSDQTQVQVCLTASKTGNYRGALIFRQGEQGNSVVQFAVWLNLSVAGSNNEPLPADDDDKNEGGSRGGSRNSNNNYYQQQVNTPAQNFEELDFEIPKEKIKLENKNQQKIEPQNNLGFLILIPLLLLTIVVLALLLARKTKH